MRYKYLLYLLLVFALNAHAQQPEKRSIRIVDTLTAKEKTNRDPVILRSELDSLVNLYAVSKPQLPVTEPVKESSNDMSIYLAAGLFLVVLLSAGLLYLLAIHHRKFKTVTATMNRKLEHLQSMTELSPNTSDMPKEKSTKNKLSSASLETKINDLNAELQKLTKENESMNRVIKLYNGVQHDYDSLKHVISKIYKVKNYPGYEKNKPENSVLQGVLETESRVADLAYDKFLKPILAITDANKNNPARMSDEDQQRLLDLLISLSLLYIEYLYLRINDLSIGGQMVERIQALTTGKDPDPALSKKLNTDHGSRALVLRMVLDKASLRELTYPVFDETNLNNQ